MGLQRRDARPLLDDDHDVLAGRGRGDAGLDVDRRAVLDAAIFVANDVDDAMELGEELFASSFGEFDRGDDVDHSFNALGKWCRPRCGKPDMFAALTPGLSAGAKWAERFGALRRGLVLGGVDRLLQAGLRLDADEAVDDFAALEDHERRDAADAVALGALRSVVDVQLHDLGGTGVLAGELLDQRGDLAARTAPGGPEVDQHGLIGLEDFAVEVDVGDFWNSAHLLSPVRRKAPHGGGDSW